MTGIERLREHGDKYQERLEGLANDMCAEAHAIADQIVRETTPHERRDEPVDGHAADVSVSAYDLLPEEDREVIAWVREHGGLAAVRGRLGERKRLVDLCRAYEDALDMMADSMDVEKSSDKVVQARRTRKAIKKLDRRLAADGLPLREGETVWVVNDHHETLRVIGFCKDGDVRLSNQANDILYRSPDVLTHERPDSWERLEDDADALLKAESNGKGSYNAANDYCNAHGLGTDGTVWVLVAQDFVRRAKALTERGE